MIATALICLAIWAAAGLMLWPHWRRYRQADRADQARHERLMRRIDQRRRKVLQ